MRAVYAHGDQWRAESGPVAAPSSPDTLFDFNRYHGGALVLYALREKIGTRAFEQLEREWVRRYRDESVGHRGLHRARLAGRRTATCAASCATGCTATKTPPMPNHPDWTVDPVEAGVQAARSAPAARRPTP